VERPSRFDLLVFTELIYDGGRGLTWCNGNDHHAAAPTLHFARADNRLFRVIAPFDDDVRPEKLDQLEGSVFIEQYDEIDAFHSREDVGPLCFATYGPGGPLEPAHRRIAIDADDERVGGRARRREKVDVSGVQEVEDAVGEGDLAFSVSPPALCRLPCRNLSRRVSRLQSLLTADGWK
jgi:hypothetical protein